MAPRVVPPFLQAATVQAATRRSAGGPHAEEAPRSIPRDDLVISDADRQGAVGEASYDRPGVDLAAKQCRL
jgi:hypothetical protein